MKQQDKIVNHRCTNSLRHGKSIRYGEMLDSLFPPGHVWCVSHYNYMDGYFALALADISHCPYCGAKLKEETA